MAVATSYNVTATQGARESLANTLRFVEPTTTPLYSTLLQMYSEIRTWPGSLTALISRSIRTSLTK